MCRVTDTLAEARSHGRSLGGRSKWTYGSRKPEPREGEGQSRLSGHHSSVPDTGSGGRPRGVHPPWKAYKDDKRHSDT